MRFQSDFVAPCVHWHTILSRLSFTTGFLQDSRHKRSSGGIMGTHCSSMDDILEEDMHHWYTKFMKESPSGLITLFELKTMLDMNGMTEEASSYVDQVFFTFDMDGVREHPRHTCSSLPRKIMAIFCQLMRQLLITFLMHASCWTNLISSLAS